MTKPEEYIEPKDDYEIAKELYDENKELRNLNKHLERILWAIISSLDGEVYITKETFETAKFPNCVIELRDHETEPIVQIRARKLDSDD